MEKIIKMGRKEKENAVRSIWIAAKFFFFLLFLFGASFSFFNDALCAAEPTSPPIELAKLKRTVVFIAEIDGVIGVPMEEHVTDIFETVGRARDEARVLILKLNTPGGLVDSMSAMVTEIAEADYPVAVWVAPSGARAASAGAFIVQSAHIAAMAPGTNIGAAHPVTGSGGDIDDQEMKKKVTNDLTAKIRAFAQERGRNVEAAESMVRESVSLTAREALEKGVIDLVAASESELLEAIDGRQVKVKNRPVTVALDNHEIRRIDITPRLRALELFSRPDIAYMALIAGIFLILLEVKTPGGFVLGISGGVLLLIASYGLRVLPVNFAGVALLVGGIVIIAADLFVGGMGILAAAGIGAMMFGGLILYRAPGAELLNMSAGFIVGVTVVIGLIFLIILRQIYKVMRRQPTSGQEGMIGSSVKIMPGTGDYAMAMLRGEYWRVLPADPETKLAPGDEVVVVRVESTILYVEPFKHKRS